MKPSLLPLLLALTLSLHSATPPPAAEPAWPAGASTQTLYMIGNGHIDPVWLWPWQEGLSVIHSTFRSALDRMNETPGFTFTASSAQFYEWVAQNDPAMLAEIKQRIDEGRWNLVGGWWIEPDLNIPSGEALVRQGLYGQRSFKKLFGRTATTGFNPDGFGHPGSLPQILAQQGLTDYVFMRPNPKENPNIPASTFWWKSPDGSRLLAYRIPIAYGDRDRDLHVRVHDIIELPAEPLPIRMAFYGVGDHGGGSTKINIASILAMQSEKTAPKLLFSTPDNFFADVRKTYGNSTTLIPEYPNELQHHAVGCYSVHAEIKKQNRQTELALITAEKITAIGSVVWQNDYPRRDFTTAWQHLLFQQFHDILAGTSIPESYDYAREAYGLAAATANNASWLAVQKLAWQIPTVDPAAEYYLVFNPHAWPATIPFEQEAKFPGGKFPKSLEDETGKRIPFQSITTTTETNRDRYRIIARVEVPAFGYRQIKFTLPPSRKLHVNKFDPADTKLENEHLRVTFDSDGRMTLLDKKSNNTLIRSASPLVMEDMTDTWSHRNATFDNNTYDKKVGEFTRPEIRAIENGAIRKTIRVVTRYGNSTLTTDWSLNANENALEARLALDWHEQFKLLKLAFPTPEIQQPAHTVETAYGTITRPTDGVEQPGHRWISLDSTRNGTSTGIAIINDAKYGYSTPGSEIRITVTRSAPFALHRPPTPEDKYEYWMDQGLQTFRLKIIPHSGWNTAQLTRAADEFTTPNFAILQGIHRGTRPQSASFLNITPSNVNVTAIKQAEDNNDLIFRLHETEGRPANATLTLTFANKTWTGTLTPRQLKTLRYNQTTGTFTETNLLEE